MASQSFEQTMQECEAMLKYARAYGRSVRAQIQSDIELVKIQREQMLHQLEANRQMMQKEADQKEKQRKETEQEIRKLEKDPNKRFDISKLRNKAEEMRNSVNELRMRATAPRSAESFCVPPSADLPSEQELVERLSDIHAELSGAIAPATPSAVLIMDETSKKGFFKFLGPVPLVRRMMIVTLLCLIAFLSLFLSPDVTATSINGDILSHDSWSYVLFNELVIVMAAALGASFYNLFEAYKYVSTASFDSKYESIYWVRFTLGIVSGVILAQFIFGAIPEEEVGNSMFSSKPLLSFLGGFSARVVHKILNSLVDGVETFVSGSTRDMLKVREAAAKVKLEDTVNALKQQNASKQAADRLHSALELTQLQQRLNEGMDNVELKSAVDQMINGLVTPVNGQGMFGNMGGNGGNTTNTVPVVNPEYPINNGGMEQPNIGGEFNPDEFLTIPDVPSGYDSPPVIEDIPPVVDDPITGVDIPPHTDDDMPGDLPPQS